MNDRRDFLKKAVTIAWTTPLILTLAGKKAGAQGAISCPPLFSPCDACLGYCCIDDPSFGCCCADALAPTCFGVCVASEADCAALNTPGTEFMCFTPEGPKVAQG